MPPRNQGPVTYSLSPVLRLQRGPFRRNRRGVYRALWRRQGGTPGVSPLSEDGVHLHRGGAKTRGCRNGNAGRGGGDSTSGAARLSVYVLTSGLPANGSTATWVAVGRTRHSWSACP